MSDIRGLDKLNKQLRALGELKHNKALLAGAIKLQELSQRKSPVDTGFMRASHGAEETDEGAQMFVSAEYAVHVHEGTRYMQGREWISQAIDNGFNQIVDAVAKAEQDLINGEVS